MDVRHFTDHGGRNGRFENPLFAEEANALDFLKQPDVTIVQALLLRFRPVNMDVLPLYIVLMFFLPPILWLMRRRPDLTLALSTALYIATWKFDLHLTAYPSGAWVFNPYAWQLLYHRPIADEEWEAVVQFMREQTATLRASGTKEPETVALIYLCQQLLSSNEFLYVD